MKGNWSTKDNQWGCCVIFTLMALKWFYSSDTFYRFNRLRLIELYSGHVSPHIIFLSHLHCFTVKQKSPTHQGSYFFYFTFVISSNASRGILEKSDLMRISAQWDTSTCLDDTFTHQLRHVRHICVHMALLLCIWLMWLWAIAPAALEHVGLN